MSDWSLVYDHYDPTQQGLRESLCTTGNGYFCTRGAFPWVAADDNHYPGTYVAGGYNRLTTKVDENHTVEKEDLVNFPNWLCLTFRINGGEWFNLDDVEVLSFQQRLDLRHGILHHDIRFRHDGNNETTLAMRRFVHMGWPHHAAQEMIVTAQNWSGTIEFCSALEGRIENRGVARYAHLASQHLEFVENGEFIGDLCNDKMIYLITRASQSRLRIGMAARTRLFCGTMQLDIPHEVETKPGYVCSLFKTDIVKGEPLRVEKICTLYTSRDKAISEPGLAAREAVDRCRDMAALQITHERAWNNQWDRCDITLHPSLHEEQSILHLHIYHLLQTTSNQTLDLDVGLPSRGWTGESYRGHIGWAELFTQPFLAFRMPNITKALLDYRYLRLGRARLNAQLAGFRGALFPWQSGSDGREEAPTEHYNAKTKTWTPGVSHMQYHSSIAVAWNVWQYFTSSGDRRWMGLRGAEIIALVARFFASMATYNPTEDRYDIDAVIGPNTFHHGFPPDKPHTGVKNNAYTNVMVAWLMDTALTALDVIDDIYLRELMHKLGIDQEELDTWADMSVKMSVPFFENGIISQFEGFETLKDLDLDAYRAKYGKIYRLEKILEEEGDDANNYKVCKQADVLMLLFLFSAEELSALFFRLGYDFEDEHYRKTLDYYLERTTHGTTVSHLVHTWIKIRNNDPRAWDMLQTALRGDLDDIIGGTTREGLHLGLMSSTADLFQRGFIGASICDGILNLDPVYQHKIKQLRCKLRFLGNWLSIDLNQDRICINAESSWSEPVTICVRGEARKLAPGSTLVFKL